MRLIVFFDLPVVKKEQRKEYTRFRKALIKDGYDMIQFSVYARICNGQDSVNLHINRLLNIIPSEGSVRYLQVTEKQFANIKVLSGEKKKKEDPKYSQQLTFF